MDIVVVVLVRKSYRGEIARINALFIFGWCASFTVCLREYIRQDCGMSRDKHRGAPEGVKKQNHRMN